VVHSVNVIEFKRDKQGLIIVWGTLEGPLGERDVKLILDTGAAMTLILPEVLDELGYSARDGENISRISTANEAPELGYKIRVHRFQSLGVGFRDFLIHAHELPSYGVEGLLGMDFLGEFDFEVRISEQRIRLERAGSIQAAGDGPA
jgi:predicted aspartyl protease